MCFLDVVGMPLGSEARDGGVAGQVVGRGWEGRAASSSSCWTNNSQLQLFNLT